MFNDMDQTRCPMLLLPIVRLHLKNKKTTTKNNNSDTQYGVCRCLSQYRDLARTQQKGGGGLVHQSILTFLAFHCNHIKLNTPKKGGGRRGAEGRMGGSHPLTLWLEPCNISHQSHKGSILQVAPPPPTTTTTTTH